MIIKLESQTKEEVTRVLYNVTVSNDGVLGDTYYLTDLQDKDGNVIDTYVRDVFGHSVDDPEIVHSIIDHLDNVAPTP